MNLCLNECISGILIISIILISKRLRLSSKGKQYAVRVFAKHVRNKKKCRLHFTFYIP